MLAAGVEADADVAASLDDNGNTFLHTAASAGAVDAIRTLVR